MTEQVGAMPNGYAVIPIESYNKLLKAKDAFDKVKHELVSSIDFNPDTNSWEIKDTLFNIFPTEIEDIKQSAIKRVKHQKAYEKRRESINNKKGEAT